MKAGPGCETRWVSTDRQGDLENIAQAQLQWAGSVHGRGDVPEGVGIDEQRTGIIEVGVIEPVDSIGAELKSVAIRPGHLKILQQSQVHVPKSRASEDVALAETASERARDHP